MKSFLQKRAVGSAVSLIGLIVLVFFLSRLTGDPTTLYLPVDASLESRERFRELHGLNQPLIVEFGQYLADLLRLDFGMSIRRSQPAIEVVLQAYVWTLWLALITMALVTVMAITVGALAAFHVGGVFDRIATFFSLIGASAPDFWIAIVAITLFSVSLGWLP
ncbi:MAG: ABC transporter permease, partial [Rhodospirillales bacterium]|nr:ABC transporter permease [Rhodospirillales bacterium]